MRLRKRTLLPLLVITAVLTAVMPRSTRLAQDYRKGDKWKHETLVAAFDFPIYKTSEQLAKEMFSASAPAIPYYQFSSSVQEAASSRAERLDMDAVLREHLMECLDSIYSVGVIDDKPVTSGRNVALDQDVAYVQKGKRAERVLVGSLFTVRSARERMLEVCSRYSASADSILLASGAYDIVRSNLFFDSQSMELVRSASGGEVSPTSGYVKAGTVIVSKGDIVTAEIAQVIDSYGREYKSAMGLKSDGFLFWTGNFLLALSLVATLLLALFFTNVGIFSNFREYSYVLLIFLIASTSAILLSRSGNDNIFYIVPFTLPVLYLQAFFRNRLIMAVYMVSLLPLLLFANDGSVLYVMFVLAGFAATYTFKYFGRGWKQFVTALVTFAVLSIVYSGAYLAGLIAHPVLMAITSLFLGSMLTVAGYPLIFLFERIFNLVSNSRLEELCNSSNGLVSALEQQAPGTFQHSLQVMNMASAVAKSVGANDQLLRTAALYHDIGKTLNPRCFVENESMLSESGSGRYHEGLTPLQSAQDIIRHVSDGVELAQKHHLPQVLVDFIRTHHGTTTTAYFYNRFLESGGDPSRKSEFSYEGPLPSSKEQMILMLCDSVEAASRTLKDYSSESFSRFVDSIVAEKNEMGQFDNADITVREIGRVKEALKQYLAQMYHARIVYPKRK